MIFIFCYNYLITLLKIPPAGSALIAGGMLKEILLFEKLIAYVIAKVGLRAI